MTPAEKAKETRKRNEEARRQKEQIQKDIREAMTKALLGVLECEVTTPAQKLKASEILHDLTKGR